MKQGIFFKQAEKTIYQLMILRNCLIVFSPVNNF